MTIFAAVPVKTLQDAKQRLEGAVADRAALTLNMLEHVLDALQTSGCVAEIAVVSPDPRVLETARRRGATPLLQSGGGLNDACRLAAEAAGKRPLLVVHGDLPELTGDEIRRLAAALPGARPAAVAAADRGGTGTNALLLAPAGALPFHFGPDSLRLHREAAVQSGVALEVFVSHGTSHDVDTPQDLAAGREVRRA